jgi:hypothetical protein
LYEILRFAQDDSDDSNDSLRMTAMGCQQTLISSAVPADPYAMGESKGGEARFFPFGVSKSFAFAQHKNKEAFPRFSAGMAVISSAA